MEPAPTHPGKPWHRRHRVRRPGGSPSANREAATPTVGQGLAGEGRHSLGHRSILVRVPKRREFNNNRESIWAPKKQRQSRGLFQPPRGLHRRANALGLFHPARADPSAIVSIATTVGRSRLASKALSATPDSDLGLQPPGRKLGTEGAALAHLRLDGEHRLVAQ